MLHQRDFTGGFLKLKRTIDERKREMTADITGVATRTDLGVGGVLESNSVLRRLRGKRKGKEKEPVERNADKKTRRQRIIDSDALPPRMITEVEKTLAAVQGQYGEVAERKREWSKSLQEGRKYGDDGHRESALASLYEMRACEK
jgi:hypothetical protein